MVELGINDDLIVGATDVGSAVGSKLGTSNG